MIAKKVLKLAIGHIEVKLEPNVGAQVRAQVRDQVKGGLE